MIAFAVSLGLSVERRRFAAAVKVRTPFSLRDGPEMAVVVPEEDGAPKEFIAAELARFLAENKIRPDFVTLSVHRSTVAIRFIEFPEAAMENISEALMYEAPKHFPLSAEDMFLGYQLLRSSGGKVGLLLAAARRSELLPVVDGIREAGLGVDALEFSSVSLARKTASVGAAPKLQALVDLRGDLLELALAQDEKLIESRWAEVQEGSASEGLGDLWRAVVEQLPDARPEKVVISGDREPPADLAEAAERLSGTGEVSRLAASALDVAHGAALRGARDQADQINLLPPHLRPRRRNVALVTAGVLGAAVFLLVLAAAWGSLYRSSAVAGALGRQAEMLRPQFEGVQSMRREIATLKEEALHFGTLQARASVRPLDILKQLTTMLPQSAHLETFSMSQDTVRIMGVEPKDTDIVPSLEESAIFKDARLSGPTTTTGSEKHFALEMKVEP